MINTPARPPPANLEALSEGLMAFPRLDPITRIDPEKPTRISLAAIGHFNAVLEQGKDTRRPGAP